MLVLQFRPKCPQLPLLSSISRWLFVWITREVVTALCFLVFSFCLLGSFKEIRIAVRNVKDTESS